MSNGVLLKVGYFKTLRYIFRMMPPNAGLPLLPGGVCTNAQFSKFNRKLLFPKDSSLSPACTTPSGVVVEFPLFDAASPKVNAGQLSFQTGTTSNKHYL
jgi:hypothetical protein